jgi:hypothetical protein
MTVNEMIERLQEVTEDGFGECEVRLAFQPRWALQFTIGGIAVPDDESRGRGEPDEEPDDADHVVYIVEGDHPRDDSPYAPSWAFPAAR